MMIAKTDNSFDLKICAEIWLDASIAAHNFIDAEFWRDNFAAMQEQYLPASEVFVVKDQSEIVGFAAVHRKTLAVLFVKPEKWGMGAGAALLRHVQEMYKSLELTVYKTNSRAVLFYQKHGFSVRQEQTCPHTGESELLMFWHDRSLHTQ